MVVTVNLPPSSLLLPNSVKQCTGKLSTLRDTMAEPGSRLDTQGISENHRERRNSVADAPGEAAIIRGGAM